MNLFTALQGAWPIHGRDAAILTDKGLVYTWQDLDRATAMLANLIDSLRLRGPFRSTHPHVVVGAGSGDSPTNGGGGAGAGGELFRYPFNAGFLQQGTTVLKREHLDVPSAAAARAMASGCWSTGARRASEPWRSCWPRRSTWR